MELFNYSIRISTLLKPTKHYLLIIYLKKNKYWFNISFNINYQGEVTISSNYFCKSAKYDQQVSDYLQLVNWTTSSNQVLSCIYLISKSQSE
jgi:hypothetical protein